MTGLEALQAVQYVTVGKERFAVVDLKDWESLIEWLETLEDVQRRLPGFVPPGAAEGERAGGGRRERGIGVSRYTVYIPPRVWKEILPRRRRRSRAGTWIFQEQCEHE